MSTLSAEATARRLVREIYSSAYRPDPAVSISTWAQNSRQLSSKTSRIVGRWDNARSPMLVEPMDCLSPESPVRRVDIVGPAQFGKTEIGLNWLGHTMDLAPCPFLLVRPDLNLAKRFSRQRLDDMIAACPTLKGKVSERKSRDSSNTTLIKEFLGGLLVITGANSAAGLRDMPAAKCWLDEVDAYPPDVDEEGDPADLAIARTTSFGRRAKVLCTSTPKIKGRSRIERGFDLGDRRRYFVPCPHCGLKQTLRWGQLKYEKGARNVHYECEKCQGKILEHQKVEMLAGGEWVPEEPSRSATHRSYHWNALYFPVGWLSWEDLAIQWENIHHPRLDVSKLRVFINTRLAEPFEEKGEAPPWEKLYRRRADFGPGTVPTGGLVLTAGVDVQGDRIQGSVYAWGRDLEHWVVDRFTLEGDTSTAAPWKALEELRTRTQYLHESGARMGIRCLAVDTGFRFHVVCNWARTKARTEVIAIKGSATVPFVLGTPKQVDVDLNGRTIARGALLWPVGVNRVKEEIYGWLNLEPPLEQGEPFPRGYCHFHSGLDREFFEQLCGEELKPRRHRNGTVSFEWEKIRERNEALDEAVYARAAAYLLGVDRWTEEDWAALEAELVPPEPESERPDWTGDSSRRRGEYLGRFREWRGPRKT